MTGLPQKLAANLSAIVLLIIGAAFAGDGPTVHEPPEWAYPLNRSGPPKPLPDDGLLHVPGSSVALPIRALTDRFGAVDWHPDQHPPMPGSCRAWSQARCVRVRLLSLPEWTGKT